MMTAEEVTGELVSPFYITATASTGQQNSRTLKSRDTFIVLDPWGDAQAFGPAAEGLFHKDTRFLSHLVLQLNGMRPVLLSSTVARENEKLATDLTNPDIYDQGNLVLARDSLHLLRTKIVGPAHCFEAIDIRSFADRDVTFTLLYGFGADFADIFEVRGRKREKRGRLTREEGSDSTAVLGYRGLDRVHRRTRLTFTPAPDRLTRAEALYRFTLPAHGEARVELTIACEIEGEPDPAASSFTRQREENVALARERRAEFSLVTSSNNSFDAWIDRSRVDLAMLITDKKTGPYPYAGIPWFSTAFGRDGLITAFECLWVAPDLARGVLEFLAANQANEISDAMDAEPGKILHETRHGEMAALYEVPFGRYYGSIDSTPLFIMLAAAYWERSGDIMFIDKIWPNLELALQWMARFGDLDGDGFLEYGR
ncbi:MAG TPA: glycogen debranching N-terminal domain-containing protein, partial [Stellaceae bacterium]|nr:glycogen debranching N-terminal domain-containing protein [Stellaceae bacterium]